MLEFLQNYDGIIKVNNQNINPCDIITLINDCKENLTIQLTPSMLTDSFIPSKQYIFTVVDWMLRKSTSSFLFMKTWNDDKPMPMKIMQGIIQRETRGMYYLQLQPLKTDFTACMICGRALTNKNSKLVGIGPECVRKLGLHININDYSSVSIIKNKLNTIHWSGWVPKTAIIEMKEV